MHRLYDQWKAITWLIRVRYKKTSKNVTTCLTGFALSKDGLVMTCAHAFPKGPYHIDARRLGEDVFFSVVVIYQKPNWDIALLRIKYVDECKFGQLANDCALYVGQTLFHIGNPKNFVASFLAGHVTYACVDDVDIPVDDETCEKYLSTATNVTPRYRVMGDVKEEECSQENIKEELSQENIQEKYFFRNNLHPHVPIIQLHGLATDDGSSGGPLLNANAEIVGMIVNCHDTYDIAIHVSMLKEVLKIHQGIEDGKKKHSSNPSAISSSSKKVKQI